MYSAIVNINDISIASHVGANQFAFSECEPATVVAANV